jgi:hypothetical protein
MNKTLRSSIVLIMLLLALFAIVYGPYIIQGGLLLDDLGFIHPELTHSTYLSYQRELSSFITMTARPISALLHGIAYWNFGSNAVLFHSVNLGLFLASVIFFFLAIQRIYSYKLAILAAILALLYPYSPATSFASIMMNSNLGALFWSVALYLSTRSFFAKPLVLGALLLCSALSYESFLPLFFLIACTQIVMHRYSFKAPYWRANLSGAVIALVLYGLYKAYFEQWLFQAQFTRVRAHDLTQLVDRTIVIASHAFKLMFIDAGPITRKSLHNLHATEWAGIALVVALTIYLLRALYKNQTLKISNRPNVQFSTEEKQAPQPQSASVQSIQIDWRDGLLAITFFLAAHSIFWFSTYLPDAQDAFATRTLGGIRFAWGFLIAIIFYKLFEIARSKISQALVTILFLMLLAWSLITIIGQRQAWIAAARINELVVNQFVNAMTLDERSSDHPINALVVMPNRFTQEVNIEPIFSTTWDITPSLKERFANRPVLAQAIYERDLARLSIQNNLVDYESTWKAPANDLYVFDATNIERGKVQNGKATFQYISEENRLRQFFVSKGLLLDAANHPLLTPGSTVTINRQLKKADVILEAGWGHPEDWGVWSIQPQAKLKLPILSNQPSTVIFTVRAFVNPKHPTQKVEVWVNGRLYQTVTLKVFEGNHFSVKVPAADSAAKQSALILLKMPDAISPKSLGLGSDDRKLGIGLAKIEID